MSYTPDPQLLYRILRWVVIGNIQQKLAPLRLGSLVDSDSYKRKSKKRILDALRVIIRNIKVEGS